MQSLPMQFCQNCGRKGPTKYVELYQNIGALILRFSKSVKGNLCKDCINQYFWSYTSATLILGWWGVISFILTPFILVNNVARYISSLTMSPPILTPHTQTLTSLPHPTPSSSTSSGSPQITPSSEENDFLSDYPTR